jgi:hypothetical protein
MKKAALQLPIILLANKKAAAQLLLQQQHHQQHWLLSELGYPCSGVDQVLSAADYLDIVNLVTHLQAQESTAQHSRA